MTETRTVPAEPKLVLRGIRKSFVARRGTVDALGPLDLDVADGEFVCVVGPSGCGKTTFLNLVAGLENPEEGERRCGGKAIVAPGPDRILIFQDLGLFPWLTVSDNVEFGLKLRGLAAEERSRRVERQLSLVHLSEFRDHYIHELSGGMKQRVALARALAMEPEVLLMDEPFAALDAQTRDVLHLELQDLWVRTRKTIVFVTHNVREAACLADRVVIFSRRPARIKRELRVDLPRPREIEEADVAAVAAQIREEIRGEIEAVVEEERLRAQKR